MNLTKTEVELKSLPKLKFLNQMSIAWTKSLPDVSKLSVEKHHFENGNSVIEIKDSL